MSVSGNPIRAGFIVTCIIMGGCDMIKTVLYDGPLSCVSVSGNPIRAGFIVTCITMGGCDVIKTVSFV